MMAQLFELRIKGGLLRHRLALLNDLHS